MLSEKCCVVDDASFFHEAKLGGSEFGSFVDVELKAC